MMATKVRGWTHALYRASPHADTISSIVMSIGLQDLSVFGCDIVCCMIIPVALCPDPGAFTNAYA